MLEIKRFMDCTLDEIMQAWNTGFEGYFVDLTMTPETFLKRIPGEDLSPALSIVAFVDGEPAGLIMNGVRTNKGVKEAWNGGTAVATKFRKQGVGRAMMKEALAIYEREGVQLAMLEAIEGNDKAIALYESLGYEIVDRLENLELKGALAENPLKISGNYTIKKAYPVQVGKLPFYKDGNPWQSNWQSAKDAEAAILEDENGNDAGYANFRKVFNEEGAHIATVVMQCEADESRDDGKEILHSLLSHVFGNFGDDIRRAAILVGRERSGTTLSVLKEIGFTPSIAQVMMNKEMSRTYAE